MIRLRSGFGKHKKEVRLTEMPDGHAVARISLGNRKLTYISVVDIDVLKEHSFYAHQRSDGKFVARSSQTREYLHRILLKPAKNLEVDHINSKPLDNTRGNLRICNTVQNNLAKERDTVGYYAGIKEVNRRVYRRWNDEKYEYYMAEKYDYQAIGKNGKVIGTYGTAFEAAKNRDRVLLEEYKEVEGNAPFHNYGFIHWNINTPDEAADMENWIYLQRETAQLDGIDLMEEYGW